MSISSPTEANNIKMFINPHVTTELSKPLHLDESIFILRGIGSNFLFLFHFSMKILSANRKALDGTPSFAASHPGAILFAYVP